MVGTPDRQLSQEVWPEPVMGVIFAGVRPLVDGLQAHDAHQKARTVATRRKPGLGKIGHDLAAAKERVLRKYLVNL